MANFIDTRGGTNNFLSDMMSRRPMLGGGAGPMPPQGGSGGEGISPRLDELGNNVSSAEEELNAINQRLNSAESKLGGSSPNNNGYNFRQEGDMGRYVADNDPGMQFAGFSNYQDYMGAGNDPVASRPQGQPIQSSSGGLRSSPMALATRTPAADGGLMELMQGKELTAGAPSIKYEGDMNPDQGSGIMEMASMESGQAATLEEIYFELIADGMDPESASIKAREIYNDMSSQPQDMMQEPRTMAADGGFIMQGGVKNYLGKQETISDVPLKWQSGANKPSTELAYITKAEKDLLLKKDIHGSLKNGPNMGPGGIMSLDSFGDIGGGQSGAQYDSGQGSGSQSEADNNAGNMGGGSQEDQDNQQANLDNAAKKQEEKFQAYQKSEEAKKKAKEFEAAQKRDAEARREGRASAKKQKQRDFFAVRSGLNRNPNEFTNDLYKDYLEEDDLESGAIDDMFENQYDSGPFKGPVLSLLDPLFKKGANVNRNYFTNKVLGKGGYKNISPEDFANMSLTQRNEIYGNYMDNRLSGGTDAYGNENPNFKNDGGDSEPFIPTPRDDSEEEAEEEEPFQLGLAFRADGGRVGKAYGGSMGDDGRRAYGLGSIFKKIKKVFKSPLGKAALIGLGGYGLSGGLGGTSFMQGLKSKGLSGLLKKAGGYALKNPGTIIPLASAAGALFTEEDEDEDNYVDNTGIDVKKIRENPYKYLPRAMRAEGGPMGGEVMEGESEELLDMNGMEKDYREDGGFVPLGEYEKKDDVPARLSKNEFVFTADAVRGAGEGDVDLGAEKLYTQMKELESVGKRMQGANEMFQTSQRLEEVV